MPIITAEIIALLSKVAEEEQLRVTFKESAKGVLTVCVITGACAVILGPIGFAVGATAGGCIATALAENKFQSAITVIRNMKPEKKEMLAQSVRHIMDSVHVTDIVLFAAMVAGQPAIRKQVVHAIAEKIKDEISATCLDH